MEYFTIPQAVELLGEKHNRIWRVIRAGYVKPLRVGHSVLLTKNEIGKIQRLFAVRDRKEIA